MNSKRIISLILSIVMTLQVFVFQTPVHAMERNKNEIQKSEGQKINDRSEVFTFNNTEKPKMNWFSAGTQSRYRARSASLTRTENLKITTETTGLDDEDFNWKAFGNNQKFTTWVEVAYIGEKDENGRPKKYKVSEDIEINKAGTIETQVQVDAQKTVDKYYLRTEYQNSANAFKIQAFFEDAPPLSPQGSRDLTFTLGIYQIVSTKIEYNLIDEYGKPIDLKDAKEEKPADIDLENLGKLGNGTDEPVATFNLKNDGTEILWQDQNLDRFDLMDSSLTLSLDKNEIKSNNIDYKLSSTYDVLNGGTVTIQRQKDAVTPKDPKNPGNIPEGYARLNLSADALAGGPTGTFNKDDDKDNRRYVDVKAGKPYTSAQAEVDKAGKPFPLTSEKKVDTGKVFDKWTPALSELGTAVAKETKNLNATYKSSDVEIIPYLPGEEVPTKDKDGLPIPTDYVTVTFNSEDATKGKVKIGDKEGATVLAKVKPGIDLSKKAEITTVPKENYGFTEWKPVLGKAAEGQSYTAHFVKSGDKINEGDPIPKDWFKVTVSQDEDSIKSGTVTKAVYTVKPNDKLGQDKFANLEGKANDGFKDPAWYVGSEKLEKPYEKEITTSTDFIARATEEIANKFKTNGLKAVDITAYKGDKIEGKFWNKGVTVQREDAVLERLIEAATVTDITETKRTTDNAGTFPGTLKVTFEDGSSLEVQNQKLIVIDTKIDIDYDKDSKKDANAPRHKDEVVKGRIKSDEALEGAKVEILDKDNNVIGITLADKNGSFIAGTRPLEAGETIKVRVTLPKARKASDAVEKVVGLNPDELNSILPTADKLVGNLKDKKGVDQTKVATLEEAIKEAYKLVDKAGEGQDQKDQKAKATTPSKDEQDKLDNAYKAIKAAIKDLTENKIPEIKAPAAYKEIFVGDNINLDEGVKVTDDNIKKQEGDKDYTYKIYDGSDKETTVENMKANAGTYRVVYKAEDTQGVKAEDTMTVVVKKTVVEVPGEFPEKIPEGYVKVEFKSGEHAGLNGVSKFLVKKDAPKSEITEPTIIPKEGYKVAEPKWSVAIPDTFADNFETEAQVLAKTTTDKPADKDMDKYATLTFEAGDHGEFDKSAKTTIYVLKNEEVKFNAPKVNANEGFTFAGWEPKLKESYKEDTNHVAQYASNSDISDTEVKGFQEVKFMAGDHGQFGNNVKEKSVWVRPGKLVDLRTKTPTVTVTTAGKSFIGWDQDLVQKFTKADTATVINARYDDTVKTTEPDAKDKEKYAKVDFVAGNLGTIENNQTKTYWVVKDAEVTDTFKAPTVTANKGWKVKTGNDAWSPAVATKYTQDTIHVAQYEYDGASVVPQKPGDEKPNVPDNFVKVEFKKGDHGVISSEENFIYWVDPTKEVELTAPAVIADTNYKHDGWKNDDAVVALTKANKFEKATDIVAQYKATVVTKDPNDANYVTVEFKAGDHGTLTGDAKFWVYKNEKVSITAPTLTAKDGYTFDKWDPAVKDSYAEATVHNATYTTNNNVSDTEVEGYNKVTFKAGEHGTLTEKSVWVKPDTVVDLNDKAPKVTPAEGYSHIGWKPALVGKFADGTEIVAQYSNNISDIPVEGWTELTFDQGDHGKLAKGAKNVKWVNPKADLKLSEIAPAIVADTNYSLDGWKDGETKVELETAQKFETAKTFTATYKEIVSTEQKEGYTEITFNSGDHGKFAEEKTEKKLWLDPESKVKLSDFAPEVIADINWTFDKWMDGEAKADLETEKAYAEAKTFTAAYKSNVIDDEKDIPADDKDNFVKITFAPGEDGKFAEGAKTSTNVRKGVVVDITNKAPTVTANEGKTFTGWDSELKRAFDVATTITAEYTDSISDKPVEGWTEILFNSGEHGRFENGTKNTIWVNPDKAVVLDKVMKDKLVPFTNYSFNKWTDAKGADANLATPKKYTEPAQFTATYKSNVIDKDEYDKLPENEKKNFVEITFDAGTDGKFAENPVNPVYVKKDVVVDLTEKAPTVIPNQGYGHSGWKPALKGPFSTATTITAQYKAGTFDENAIKEITVLGPTKMSYNEGEDLDLAGLKVIAKDDAGLLKTYEGADAIKAVFNIEPANGTKLTADHNNKPIKVTKGEAKGETVTRLAVHENQSAEPTDVLARNLGKDPQKTTVTGKAPKDSVIKITDINGNDLTDGTEIKVGKNGKFTVELKDKLEPGTPIKVTSTEPGKTESSPVVKQVFDDVNKDGVDDKTQKTPTPTIVFAANQNTAKSDGTGASETAKNKTTVKFTVKNKPTTVYVKYTVNGENKEETFEIGENDDATKTVDLAVKLPVGAEVQVLAKDADKLISEAAKTTVVRDANNDGTADDKTPLEKATIDPIKAQSESITVTPPEGATELVIKETDKSGNTPKGSKEITVTKDKDGIWKIGDDIINPDKDGKLTIPKGTFKLDEYNVVEVESKGDPDTTTPSTAKEVVGKAADKTAPDKPKVDQPVDGDKDIKVKTPTDKDAKTIIVKVTKPAAPAAPGEEQKPDKVETITVTKDGENWKIGDTPVKEDENGKLVIPVPELKTDDTVTVEVKDETGNTSVPDSQKVVERQKLPEPTINPIKINEKAVAGTAKDATTVDIYKKVGDNYELIKEGVGVNSDGTYNYPGTTPFKYGDVIRVVAKKDGWTPNSAEITVGVDTTALDKAIQDGKDALDKTNDGTPEDKVLEKAIKDAEDLKKRTDPTPPTQDELDNAQKEIEKAIENKKKTDEERQKLKDIIKEAEEETQKDGYKDKPGKDRRELEKAIKEGKTSLENNTKVPESTTRIEKALEKIRKEKLEVGLRDVTAGDRSITITTYPSYCEVEIFINDISKGKVTTNGLGLYRYTLDQGESIESGASIELKAHKDGYNDDSYWTQVN